MCTLSGTGKEVPGVTESYELPEENLGPLKKTRSAAGSVVTVPPQPVARAFNPSPQMAEADRF